MTGGPKPRWRTLLEVLPTAVGTGALLLPLVLFVIAVVEFEVPIVVADIAFVNGATRSCAAIAVATRVGTR